MMLKPLLSVDMYKKLTQNCLVITLSFKSHEKTTVFDQVFCQNHVNGAVNLNNGF